MRRARQTATARLGRARRALAAREDVLIAACSVPGGGGAGGGNAWRVALALGSALVLLEAREGEVRALAERRLDVQPVALAWERPGAVLVAGEDGRVARVGGDTWETLEVVSGQTRGASCLAVGPGGALLCAGWLDPPRWTGARGAERVLQCASGIGVACAAVWPAADEGEPPGALLGGVDGKVWHCGKQEERPACVCSFAARVRGVFPASGRGAVAVDGRGEVRSFAAEGNAELVAKIPAQVAGAAWDAAAQELYCRSAGGAVFCVGVSGSKVPMRIVSRGGENVVAFDVCDGGTLAALTSDGVLRFLRVEAAPTEPCEESPELAGGGRKRARDSSPQARVQAALGALHTAAEEAAALDSQSASLDAELEELQWIDRAQRGAVECTVRVAASGGPPRPPGTAGLAGVGCEEPRDLFGGRAAAHVRLEGLPSPCPAGWTACLLVRSRRPGFAPSGALSQEFISLPLAQAQRPAPGVSEWTCPIDIPGSDPFDIQLAVASYSGPKPLVRMLYAERFSVLDLTTTAPARAVGPAAGASREAVAAALSGRAPPGAGAASALVPFCGKPAPASSFWLEHKLQHAPEPIGRRFNLLSSAEAAATVQGVRLGATSAGLVVALRAALLSRPGERLDLAAAAEDDLVAAICQRVVEQQPVVAARLRSVNATLESLPALGPSAGAATGRALDDLVAAYHLLRAAA